MTFLSAPATSSPAHGTSAPNGAAPLPTSISFQDLGLVEPLLRALRDEKYTHPTPIQAQAIPQLLAGKDLLGCANTGTGKTAAFVLPLLQRFCDAHAKPAHDPRGETAHAGPRGGARTTRALILVPTRELAAQVRQSIDTYGRHVRPTTAVVYGGVGQGPQVRALSRGVDFLVATPGRLLDLMGQGHVRLDRVEVLVLDEADQMLDLGFLPAVQRILREIPRQRQTLLFSATMPPAIAKLADGILVRPVKVVVAPVGSTVETVDQCVHFVDRAGKPELLARVLSEAGVERALVFTRTKRGADRVARSLVQRGIPAQAIHGNKSQNARERALEGFRRGKSPVLVATDIAARGIDVDGITHVVNYELPNVPESYVHRIGRTARAGARGVAISLCDREERAFLRDIERLTRLKIRVAGGDASEPLHERFAKRASDRAPARHHGGPRESRSHGSRGPAHHGGSRAGHGPRRSPAPRHAAPSPTRADAPRSSVSSHSPAFGSGT